MIIYNLRTPVDCEKSNCVGVTGENLTFIQKFFIGEMTDSSFSYSIHLRFADGQVNTVIPDEVLVDSRGTTITWNVKETDIFIHGYFELQIEGRNDDGKVFQTEIVRLYADESIPIEDMEYENPNTETLRLREEAYNLLSELKLQQEQLDTNMKNLLATDITKKADKAQTENELYYKLDCPEEYEDITDTLEMTEGQEYYKDAPARKVTSATNIFSSQLLSCSTGEKYRITSAHIAGYPVVVFFDENLNFISWVCYEHPLLQIPFYTKVPFTIPENCCYMGINFFKYQNTTLALEKVIPKQIDVVQMRTELEAEISNCYTKSETDDALAQTEKANNKVEGLATGGGYVLAELDEPYPSLLYLKQYYYKADEVDAVVAEKADKATTLAGYDIADAYSKTEIASIVDEKADKNVESLISGSQALINLKDTEFTVSGLTITIRNNHIHISGTPTAGVTCSIPVDIGITEFEEGVNYVASVQNILRNGEDEALSFSIYLWGTYPTEYQVISVPYNNTSCSVNIDTAASRSINLRLNITTTGKTIDREFDFMIEQGEEMTDFTPYYISAPYSVNKSSLTADIQETLDAVAGKYDSYNVESGSSTLTEAVGEDDVAVLSTASATYQKFGDFVTVQFNFAASLSMTEDKTINISGLPFRNDVQISTQFVTATTRTVCTAIVSTYTSNMILILPNGVKNGERISGSITYKIY